MKSPRNILHKRRCQDRGGRSDNLEFGIWKVESGKWNWIRNQESGMRGLSRNRRRFCDKCDECDEGNEENEIFYILLFIFFYSFMISHRHTCHRMTQTQYSSGFQLWRGTEKSSSHFVHIRQRFVDNIHHQSENHIIDIQNYQTPYT